MNTEVLPILRGVRENVRFAYNPYFIAMGTTIDDFMKPEFFLIGSENNSDAQELSDFYEFVGGTTKMMKIESAELTKVAYSTFIGFKIVFANALSEIVQSYECTRRCKLQVDVSKIPIRWNGRWWRMPPKRSDCHVMASDRSRYEYRYI
jgi:UDP-glucose 6-dehydrogenase